MKRVSAWLRRAACLLLLAGATASATAAAQAPAASLLHPLFQDHAVLQRGQPLQIRGQAAPGETVRVELAGRTAKARADAQGEWQATLPALAAGGPYTLSARAGSQQQSIADVLIGDVWLCSGQSNMELPVWRTLDARAEIAAARNDRIRLLTVPQIGNAAPRAQFPYATQWTAVTPDSVREFSAACYYFARELQARVDVPMGLIDASWGGSRIQAWMSAAALRQVGGYDEALAILDRYAVDPLVAACEWGEFWQRWWQSQPGIASEDRPWMPGTGKTDAWQPAPPQLGAWEHWGVPALADFNGMVWYRAQVTLSAEQAAQPAVLSLGAADEIDMSWVNGRAVGSSYGADAGRSYRVPGGLLHAGVNDVVVNVLDTYREGGLAGPAARHALLLADGSSLPLHDWRYRPMPASLPAPPRAPWQTAAGLSTLYNGMIAPLGRYGLRGVLWYQGESNTDEAAHYADLLRALRSDWRARFGTSLPWLIVQLAAYGDPPAAAGESGWADLREVQRRVAAEDARSGLALTIDIGDRYDIHPPNKQELGRRLARVARQVVYGEPGPLGGAAPASVVRVGDELAIAFGGGAQALASPGAAGPVGFQLCGEAVGSCRFADARIDGVRVRVHVDAQQDVTRVRYCWADNPVCTLVDGEGQPVGPFEMVVSGATSPAASASTSPPPRPESKPGAQFDWFEYVGLDDVFRQPLADGHYRNPILPGFHADPSITRVGDRYYLVNSSFTYFPGIPIHESRDLINWTLIGHVIDSPSLLDFDGLSVSRGIFAPAISYHAGVFYVVTTAVDSGGNFVTTARNPAGPWSAPTWLPGVDGIDPSLFFDDDGRAYLINNDVPATAPRYDGHRAIWMQEFDIAALKPIGPRRVLLDGGVDPATHPIWIEGPHIFKHQGWYYLSCAEGGTGPQHSQVVLRSRDVWGPYQPYPHNPILTQRDLPDDRPYPITNAGHADLVQTPAGDWWAVFLASRNYDRVHYNTGRETFLLPVTWHEGWPRILEAGKPIPYVAPAPAGASLRATSQAGNFLRRDEFTASRLGPDWNFVRMPKRRWFDLRARPGWLTIQPSAEGLDTLRNPSFLARWQQHAKFRASTRIAWPAAGVKAGLAAFQNEKFWYALSLQRTATGGVIQLERNRDGVREVVATQQIDARALQRRSELVLTIVGQDGRYDFGYDNGDGLQWLRQGEDGSLLSTDVAGGFVGASLGPFAQSLQDPGVAPAAAAPAANQSRGASP